MLSLFALAAVPPTQPSGLAPANVSLATTVESVLKAGSTEEHKNQLIQFLMEDDHTVSHDFLALASTGYAKWIKNVKMAYPSHTVPTNWLMFKCSTKCPPWVHAVSPACPPPTRESPARRAAMFAAHRLHRAAAPLLAWWPIGFGGPSSPRPLS